MVRWALIFLLIEASSELVLGFFDLPEHGTPGYVTYELSHNHTTMYIMNFTRPRDSLFAYLWLRMDCEVPRDIVDTHWPDTESILLTIDKIGQVDILRSNLDNDWEMHHENIPHRIRMASGASPVVRSTYYWVFSLSEHECLNPDWCAFGLITKPPASKCIAWIRGERGRKLGMDERYIYGGSNPSNGGQTSTTAPEEPLMNVMVEPQRRLFAIDVPPKSSLPVVLNVQIEGKVFISYAWGYTTELSTAVRYGSFAFELPVSQPYEADQRLFVWIDVQAPTYELSFSTVHEEELAVFVVILIPSLVFCITFVSIFGGMYICVQATEHDLEIHQLQFAIPPSVDDQSSPSHHRATYEELSRISSIVSWGKASESKRVKCDSCVICMEKFEYGEVLRVLRCRHCFHQVCIDPWLLAKRDNCPICYQSIGGAQDLYRSATRSPQAARISRLEEPITKDPIQPPAHHYSFVKRVSNFFKFPSTYDDMTIERSISRPFEKMTTLSSDGSSIQLPSTTTCTTKSALTSGKSRLSTRRSILSSGGDMVANNSSWSAFRRRLSMVDKNEESSNSPSIPPYMTQIDTNQAKKKNSSRGSWQLFVRKESSPRLHRSTSPKTNMDSDYLGAGAGMKLQELSQHSISLKKGGSNNTKSGRSVSLKRGDEPSEYPDEFQNVEDSDLLSPIQPMLKRTSSVRAAYAMKRSFSTNSQKRVISTDSAARESVSVGGGRLASVSVGGNRLISLGTSDAEVLNQSFWELPEVAATESSGFPLALAKSGGSAHCLLNEHEMLVEYVSRTTDSQGGDRLEPEPGSREWYSQSLLNSRSARTSMFDSQHSRTSYTYTDSKRGSLFNSLRGDSRGRPSLYESYLSVPTASSHVSGGGAGKTVATILLNRNATRDSMIMDSSVSHSYPGYVHGDDGPPRLSKIDINFSRPNSLPHGMHVPAVIEGSPLPDFLTSKQSSLSSKKTSDSELVYKSSESRLQFYGLETNPSLDVVEESESDFTSSAIHCAIVTADGAHSFENSETEDLPSDGFEDGYSDSEA